jgi:hypothetical protein
VPTNFLTLTVTVMVRRIFCEFGVSRCQR